VTISVTDGSTTATLAPFSIAVRAPTATTATGSATLSWAAPTQNTDGSALINLAGYAIYYGTSPTSLTKRITVASAATTTYTVANLSPGTYYFGLAAFTSTGVESALSSVGSKTIF
jgi:hypothetical protein